VELLNTVSKLSNMSYQRPQVDALARRLTEPRRFVQVLAGPRQVGKTTIARQALEGVTRVGRYASADDPGGRDLTWLRSTWDLARLDAREGGRRGAVLVLDEVQKIPGWADVVKMLWDEDSAQRTRLHVVVLGSSPLLVQRGLGESLAGRFELTRVPHWSYGEMREAFGWDLDRYVFFGGYPGAASLVGDRRRWARYIQDSLVETTLSRDILLMTRIDKPALLRQLFRLACDHSGQIVSYQRMVGQLQDAGNTTTLAHYLELLGGAGLVAGLQKYSGSRVRQRGSSPKLLALNNSLVSSQAGVTLRGARRDHQLWGRLVESAVGAHLLTDPDLEVTYWRDRNREVDLVVRSGRSLTAIEVTSGRRKDALPGLRAFTGTYPKARSLLVGGQGLPLEEFLERPASHWVG
jgi:predicted AAA+ superfamily ATPase